MSNNRLGLIIMGKPEYSYEARQHIEYYSSCGTPLTVFTTNKQLLPKYFYQAYKGIQHQFLSIFTFLWFIGAWFTQSFVVMKLYTQKINKIHVFIENYNNNLFKAIINYAVMKNCKLNIFFGQNIKPEMKKEILNVYKFMKNQIISVHQKIEENQVLENRSDFQFIFSSIEIKKQVEELCEIEFPKLCYQIFDRQIILYNQTNTNIFQQHQIGLFNKMIFTQPEKTNTGTRNLYFQIISEQINKTEEQINNVKDEDEKVENENKQEKQEEVKYRLEKNPKQPQLIIVPLSSTYSNNNFENIKIFIEEVEKYLKVNASITSNVPYHYVQFVFTIQPIDKNGELFKQFQQQIKQFNKQTEHTRSYLTMVIDPDWEVLIKSCSFALIARTNKSQIVQKLNEFKVPCGILCEQDDEIEEIAGNLMFTDKNAFGGFYALLTEGEINLKDKLLEGDNTWDL